MPEKQPKPVSPEQPRDDRAEQEDTKERGAFDDLSKEIIDRFYEGADKLGSEDRAYLTKFISSEIDSISREEAGNPEAMRARIKEFIISLKSSNEVKNSTASDNKEKEATVEQYRPNGVPSTEEVKASKEALEEEPVRGNMIARAWDNFMGYTGMTMFKVGEFISRKKYEGSRQKPGETDEAYAKRMKRRGTMATIGCAAISGGIIYLRLRGANVIGEGSGDAVTSIDIDPTTSNIPDSMPEGMGSNGAFDGLDLNHDGIPDVDLNHDGIPDVDLNHDGIPDIDQHLDGTMFDGYNPTEDAFNQPGKLGIHDWGTPLSLESADGSQFDVPGMDDMVNNHWTSSPEQMSTVAAEMGLDGFNTNNIEDMAAQMKNDPAFAQQTHDQLLAILNDPNTRISEGDPLSAGTYGSYYETMIGDDGVVSYDNVIDQPGTTMKVEFIDKNGINRVIEFKRECGGQIIHRHPQAENVIPQYVAPQEYSAPVQEAPQGGAPVTPEVQQEVVAPAPVPGHEVPQGGGTPPTPEKPPVETVPPVETPPIETPPIETPPVETPPIETPPVSDIKDWSEVPDQEGWTVDDNLYEQTDNPAIVGNGTDNPNMDTIQVPGGETDVITAPESTIGTGGTREELGVGNFGEEAAVADLNQGHESAVTDATVETGATTNDNVGEEIVNPF